MLLSCCTLHLYNKGREAAKQGVPQGNNTTKQAYQGEADALFTCFRVLESTTPTIGAECNEKREGTPEPP